LTRQHWLRRPYAAVEWKLPAANLTILGFN
jgi:hypothetical protein